MPSILIYGYGNPGRQDDGVGPALVAALEEWTAAGRPRSAPGAPERLLRSVCDAGRQVTRHTGAGAPVPQGLTDSAAQPPFQISNFRRPPDSPIRLSLDSNYQLNAEDALAVSQHDAVIFVDAVGDGDEPFSFRLLAPAATVTFSTHAMPPEAVLALCSELYGKCPEAHLLAIRGHAWEPNAPLTPVAAANLAAALAFLKQQLSSMVCAVNQDV